MEEVREMTTRENNAQIQALWGNGTIRAFISHTHEHKRIVAALKSYLKDYGFASFVPHEDIEPLKEWENEIVNALRSMDVLIALLTDDFHESEWTDQEIGAAVGQSTPIIPVRMGCDPYGFVKRHQAISWPIDLPVPDATKKVAQYIFEALQRDGLALDNGMYIQTVARANNFDHANHLASLLGYIDSLSSQQEQALVDAYNENDQVYNAWDFQGRIVPALRRITGHAYQLSDDKMALCRVEPILPEDMPFP